MLDADGLTLAERDRGPAHLIEVFPVDEECPGFSSLVQMVMFKGAYHLEDQRYADPIQPDEMGMNYPALVKSGRCTIIGRWTDEAPMVSVLDPAHEDWLLR